jgi:hypothetical protein
MTATPSPLLVCLACAPLCLGGAAVAQTAPPPSNNDISKEVENPVTTNITLPLRYEATFNDGPDNDSTKSTFELDQAVVPFSLDADWSLITRTKMPFVSDPPKKHGKPWQLGMDNGYTTFFLSPSHGSTYFWGVGPVLYYPTATNSNIGVNKWGLGPSVAFLKKDASPWEWGIIVNNIWSLGGPPHGKDRSNSFLVNPFLSYHFGDGWAVGSSPDVESNWLAKPGQDWTLPVGGGISKTFRLGKLPIRVAFDSYYNAIRADAGNQTWLAEVTMTMVFAQ